MRTVNLKVSVPKNRNLTGYLYVEEDGKLLRTITLLARGNVGPGDTQFKKDGSTPTGTYDGSAFVPTNNWDPDAYGSYGAIVLKPIEGNAIFAQDFLGRRGLLIHGGRLGGPGYWRGKGELRNTKGCLRVSNEDMLFLNGLLTEDLKNRASRKSAPKVTVTVRE